MFRTNIPVSPASPREWSVIRIYTYKKYYWSAVLSNQTILRRYLCQVDLEGKLKYLRNTGGFPGHNMLNNWSLQDQGRTSTGSCKYWYLKTLPKLRACLCIMSVFSVTSVSCVVHAFVLFFVPKLRWVFSKESYKTLMAVREYKAWSFKEKILCETCCKTERLWEIAGLMNSLILICDGKIYQN